MYLSYLDPATYTVMGDAGGQLPYTIQNGKAIPNVLIRRMSNPDYIPTEKDQKGIALYLNAGLDPNAIYPLSVVRSKLAVAGAPTPAEFERRMSIRADVLNLARENSDLISSSEGLSRKFKIIMKNSDFTPEKYTMLLNAVSIAREDVVIKPLNLAPPVLNKIVSVVSDVVSLPSKPLAPVHRNFAPLPVTKPVEVLESSAESMVDTVEQEERNLLPLIAAGILIVLLFQ